MKIVVNGELVEVDAVTLEAALIELGYGDALIATAVNRDFVPKTERSNLALNQGDVIEIIAPMQGG